MTTPGDTPRSPGRSGPGRGSAADRASKIQHPSPGIGQRHPHVPGGPMSNEPEPVPVADLEGPVSAQPKITAFGKEKRRHEEQWSRTPNTTGTGAIHVKTFHGKLTDDALVYMDQCINEWLDAHPQYEVKFVNSTVGVLTGKLKEPHLVCQVWV